MFSASAIILLIFATVIWHSKYIVASVINCPRSLFDRSLLFGGKNFNPLAFANVLEI